MEPQLIEFDQPSAPVMLANKREKRLSQINSQNQPIDATPIHI